MESDGVLKVMALLAALAFCKLMDRRKLFKKIFFY